MGIGLAARIRIATTTYGAAVVAARRSSNRAAWGRLLRAAKNLRDALSENERTSIKRTASRGATP
jgi:hypothetical protein